MPRSAIGSQYKKVNFLLRREQAKNLLTIRSVCAKLRFNFIRQTDEAEITAAMPLQRACDAGSQVRNTLSNGPRRAQSNVMLFPQKWFCFPRPSGGGNGKAFVHFLVDSQVFHKVFCDVAGRRYLPGICWYPAKRTGWGRESRWHRG